MGVDITAYKQIKKIECHFNADGEPIKPGTDEPMDYDDYEQFYKNPDFPGRADDIEDKGVYSCEDADHVFCISYGGYNRLRDQLAKVAGYPLGQYEQYGKMYDSYCVDCWHGKTGPFSELINFSDCEGVIGTTISAKLAKDFADFQEKAEAEGDERFLAFYHAMKSGFEMASDSGAVRFH